MAWLGEELPKDQQKDKTPFAPRCIKDRIEEALFAHRRDLFTDLQLVFFDTTSIYFEGEGGQRHRPAGLQQGPSARPVPDGRRGRARRPGAADLLRTVARQHDRRDDADPGRRSPPQPLRDRPGLHRGRPGHDQQGDDRGVGAGRAGLAVHPGCPDAVAERGEGRGAVPGRSLPGRASRARSRATTLHP